MADLFGLTTSQGGSTDMLRRAEARFAAGRDTALAALAALPALLALHHAEAVACDETGKGQRDGTVICDLERRSPSTVPRRNGANASS